MALVTKGFEVVVSMIDRGSNQTTRTYDLDPDIDTYAEAVTAKDDILAALAGVSALAVTGFSIKEKFEENALTIPTTSGAEVSAHAEISGILNGFATKRGTIDIPGPRDTIWVDTTGPNFNVVDTTNAAVLAYAGLFGIAANLALVSDGEQFATAPDLVGKRTHSKSRRG